MRDQLRVLGLTIPADTHFLPMLHNTTTDQVLLYDTDAVLASLKRDLLQLRSWLRAAGGQARAERALSPGMARLANPAQSPALDRAVLQRANDWA